MGNSKTMFPRLVIPVKLVLAVTRCSASTRKREGGEWESIISVIPDMCYRKSMSIAVIPDIFNRESILVCWDGRRPARA